MKTIFGITIVLSCILLCSCTSTKEDLDSTENDINNVFEKMEELKYRTDDNSTVFSDSL